MNNDSFNSGNIELGSAENQRSAFIFYYSVMPLYQIVEKKQKYRQKKLFRICLFF
jgi:phosphopentomutase